VPVYNALGNHEMQSRQDAIATLVEHGWDLYGSFDVGRYHFVALNTDEWCKEQRVCGEQLDWLRTDLADHRDAAGIFVFMHRPIHSWFAGDFNPDDADELRALFRTYPVRAVFAAHDHMYYLEEDEGIRYYTTGGGGAPLYAQPQDGGFSHYLLVSVSPEGIDYNVVEPFHIEVEYTAGNDGRSARATAVVANTTDRDLILRNVMFRMPPCGSFRVSADFENYARERQPVRVRVVDVERRDGADDVRVEVEVPTGTAFYITVESK
jgi:3',5'-cyclic AMP phosphodiesterase CpdA